MSLFPPFLPLFCEEILIKDQLYNDNNLHNADPSEKLSRTEISVTSLPFITPNLMDIVPALSPTLYLSLRNPITISIYNLIMQINNELVSFFEIENSSSPNFKNHREKPPENVV